MVFGAKSAAKQKLFEQPLDKLFDSKAIKQFHEALGASDAPHRSPLCNSISVPLTSTWAKLSQDNSPTKRKRAAARLRRNTIDANNNNSGQLVSSITFAQTPPIALVAHSVSVASLGIAHGSLSLGASPECPPTGASEASYLRQTTPPLSSQQQPPPTATLGGSRQPYGAKETKPHNSAGELLAENERRQLLLNILPGPIRCLLNQLYLKGPSTVGIFRKSPNAKHCRELRQKLETGGQSSTIEQFQVNVIASVFKEWLRSLPDCLLMSRLYPQWIDVAKLIEPLHLHELHQVRLQQQQQQQLQQLSPSVSSTSTANEDDDADEIVSKSKVSQLQIAEPSPTSDKAILNGSQEAKATTSAGQPSLRPTIVPSSMTDNNYHPATTRIYVQHRSKSSSHHHKQHPLVRARSCSIMTSDNDLMAHDGHHRAALAEINIRLSCNGGKLEGNDCHQSGSINDDVALVANQHLLHIKRSHHSSTSLINNGTPPVELQKSSSYCQENTTLSCSPSSMNMSEFALRERRSECIRIIRQLLDRLNEANLILLQAFVCVLWHIANNSEHNKMSSTNLGVCVGQSLLNDERQHKGNQQQGYSSSANNSITSSSSPTSALLAFSAATFARRHRRARSQNVLPSAQSLTSLAQFQSSSGGSAANQLESNSAQETAKYVPILVAFMIDNVRELFGQEIVGLFGPPAVADSPEIQKTVVEVEANEPVATSDKQQQPADPTMALISDNDIDKSSVTSLRLPKQPADQMDFEDEPSGENDADAAVTSKVVEEPDIIAVSSTTSPDNVDVCDGRTTTTTSPPPTTIPAARQQRPLSATESTGSSSRASSSTSGLHSESPAFSSEPDSHDGCVSSSYDLLHSYRMPKIPFQYTTSCYGGEAVLYYPSYAHQRHRQQQQRANYQVGGVSSSRVECHHQRHSLPCNNQLRQYNYRQQQQHQNHHSQQQPPQRSHVMLLRDYYLSLQQQQQQQQQHYQQFLSHQQQQRAATLSNHQLRSSQASAAQQQQQQQQQHLRSHHQYHYQQQSFAQTRLRPMESLASRDARYSAKQPLNWSPITLV